MRHWIWCSWVSEYVHWSVCCRLFKDKGTWSLSHGYFNIFWSPSYFGTRYHHFLLFSRFSWFLSVYFLLLVQVEKSLPSATTPGGSLTPCMSAVHYISYIQEQSNTDTFKRHLKTFLFEQCYSSFFIIGRFYSFLYCVWHFVTSCSCFYNCKRWTVWT